ncbi:MAG: hypothetical protein ACLFSQ_02495 [Candidatus Zixiibacteriota bacterium]
MKIEMNTNRMLSRIQILLSKICKIDVPNGALVKVFNIHSRQIAKADGRMQNQPWSFIREPKNRPHGTYFAQIPYNNGKASGHRLVYMK